VNEGCAVDATRERRLALPDLHVAEGVVRGVREIRVDVEEGESWGCSRRRRGAAHEDERAEDGREEETGEPHDSGIGAGRHLLEAEVRERGIAFCADGRE
jgi:hypothetical protein